jgi:hypothetical protein
MTKIKTVLVFTLLLGFMHASLAHAQHVAYDNKHTITLTGIVTKFSLASPHSSVALDVKDDTGNVIKWTVGFGVLKDLKEQGWSDDTLKPGDEIKVAVHPQKDGGHAAILASGTITYADSRALPLNPPKPQQTVHRSSGW